MEKLRVNHVMSSDVKSGIFTAILSYFQKYTPQDIDIKVSEKPLKWCDIYHYHRPHLEPYLRGKAIATVHHDLMDTDAWLEQEVFFERYSECKKIICLNSAQSEILGKHGLSDTCVVIPHGVAENVISLKEKRPVKGRKIKIGFFSKRYGRKVKGEAYLYELMKHLDPEYFEWVFVGEGRTRECWYARELGFNATVYEYLPYRVFGALYEEIDLLLMCSWFEGGPANVPEALASGTPLFAFPVGMVKDFIKDGVNGRLLTGDVYGDAAVLSSYCVDGRLGTLQEISCTVAGDVPTWRDVVDMTVKVYRQVAGELS